MIQPAPRTEFVRLETTGRKTGLPHIVELRYAVVGDSFFFFPGDQKSDWVLNVLRSGRGNVRTDDAVFAASARLATDLEKTEARAVFVRKYGRKVVEGWYKGSPTCLCLTPTGPPRLRRVQRGELDATTSFEDWVRDKPDYYAEVRNAFDLASEEYDFTISHNFINTWIRKRSIAILSQYINPDDVLLEVGCGTGAEAMQISKLAKRIIAMDVSQKMVRLLQAKAEARGLQGKVTPLRLSASEISEVAPFLVGEKVRVAYSFNGALNCEPRMDAFVKGLSGLLSPSGYFVCSIRNTICLSEMLSHALVLQFDRATPRKKQPAMVSVGGTDIPSTYYPAMRFIEFFRPYFRPVKVVGLPTLLPPAYLNSYYLRFRGRFPLLERLDALFSSKFPFNQLGDQTLFVFQKVGA
jgi:deazaflavin-dependent oxidoreductase (nitroreductase family)